MERRQDISLGLFFTVLGLAAAWLARSYTGASGVYPSVLGLVMALTGILIAGRAVRSVTTKERTLVSEPRNLLIAIAACVLYVAFVVPLGFYTTSLLLMLGLPALLGFRQPVYLFVMALAFTGLVWIVFSLVLEKPLPVEIWASIRLGGN